MHRLAICILLWGIATPVIAQDVGATLQEDEYRMVQSFKLTWTSQSTHADINHAHAKFVFQRATEMAAPLGVATNACRDNELSADDSQVLDEAGTLFDMLKVASEGDQSHVVKLQTQRNATTDYGAQLALYTAQVSAKTRIEMYGVIYPTMKIETDSALLAVNSACIFRRIQLANPKPGISKFVSAGLKASAEVEEIFLKYDVAALKASFNFINGVRL